MRPSRGGLRLCAVPRCGRCPQPQPPAALLAAPRRAQCGLGVPSTPSTPSTRDPSERPASPLWTPTALPHGVPHESVRCPLSTVPKSSWCCGPRTRTSQPTGQTCFSDLSHPPTSGGHREERLERAEASAAWTGSAGDSRSEHSEALPPAPPPHTEARGGRRGGGQPCTLVLPGPALGAHRQTSVDSPACPHLHGSFDVWCPRRQVIKSHHSKRQTSVVCVLCAHGAGHS